MFSLDFIQRLDVVGTIQRYCDLAYAAQTIIITLPKYNNHNAKKAAAVNFGEEIVQKKISLWQRAHILLGGIEGRCSFAQAVLAREDGRR